MQDCLKGLKYIQNDLIIGTVSPFFSYFAFSRKGRDKAGHRYKVIFLKFCLRKYFSIFFAEFEL